MRATVIFILFLCSYTGLSQSNTLDSLANRVNSENREFKKTFKLESALRYLLYTDYEFEAFEAKLNLTTLTTSMLLSIDAFETRRQVTFGTYNFDSTKTERNPYSLYYRSIYFFKIGRIDLAVNDLNIIASKFTSLSDSSYASSAFNNLGAAFWSTGNLDSALLSFRECKAYNPWYDEILESNILGLAISIEDIELSLEQIATITANNSNCINPLYLNNLFSFVNAYDPALKDSVRLIIDNAYPSVEELPDELLNLFVEQNWKSSETIPRMMSMPNNPYFQLSLARLTKSEAILNPEVTDSVLKILYNKIADEEIRSRLQLFLNTDSVARKNLLSYINTVSTDEKFKESATRLKKLVENYRVEKILSQKAQQRIIYLFFVALTLILVVVVFVQRAKIQETKMVGVLTTKNTSLEATKVLLSKELNDVRKSLNSIARENIQKLEQLWLLMKDLDSTDENRTQMYKDLNVIRTHQEGITRFKISKFCDDLTSDHFDSIASLISEKEFQLLKLIALEFRSKEIAILLNVSPQYVNNQRHKIRVLLGLHGYEFDQILSDLRNDLFQSNT